MSRPPAAPAQNPLSEVEFNNLLMQYQPMLSNAARFFPAQEREDFVQAVNLHAIERRDSFDQTLGSFATWLHWQMRGLKKQTAERYKRIDALTDSMATGSDDRYHEDVLPSVFVDPAHAIDLATVTALLDTIPGGDILLARADGELLEDLADARGVSKQAIEQRTRAVRSALKYELYEPDPEYDERHARRAENQRAFKERKRAKQQPAKPMPAVLMRSTSSLTRLHDLMAMLPSHNPHSASLTRA